MLARTSCEGAGVLPAPPASGKQGGGVAFWAHVGGFVAGAILVLLFRDPRLLERHPYHGWQQHHTPTQNWRQVGRQNQRHRELWRLSPWASALACM
jgi:hypothetical protein